MTSAGKVKGDRVAGPRKTCRWKPIGKARQLVLAPFALPVIIDESRGTHRMTGAPGTGTEAKGHDVTSVAAKVIDFMHTTFH